MAVVWRVTCACGEDLDVVSLSLDSGGDLSVDVSKCENCRNEYEAEAKTEADGAYEDGKKEGYDNALAEGTLE